jgi:hypothetical protein
LLLQAGDFYLICEAVGLGCTNAGAKAALRGQNIGNGSPPEHNGAAIDIGAMAIGSMPAADLEALQCGVLRRLAAQPTAAKL